MRVDTHDSMYNVSASVGVVKGSDADDDRDPSKNLLEAQDLEKEIIIRF